MKQKVYLFTSYSLIELKERLDNLKETIIHFQILHSITEPDLYDMFVLTESFYAEHCVHDVDVYYKEN